MSLVSHLYEVYPDDFRCNCPACGEEMEGSEMDYNGEIEDCGETYKEYSVFCPYCDQQFYAAKCY